VAKKKHVSIDVYRLYRCESTASTDESSGEIHDKLNSIKNSSCRLRKR